MIVLLGGFQNSVGAEAINNIALDTIFFPLAVLGLLRLCAAPWLTDNWFYDQHESRVNSRPTLTRHTTSASDQILLSPGVRTASSMALFSTIDQSQEETRFHGLNSWRGILFRVFFLLPILGLLVMTLIYLIPFSDHYIDTTLLLVLNVFYLVFLASTFFIYSFYFFRGQSATTVIPCIVETWYQIYTCILGGLALLMIVVAAVETRRTLCGTYTTWPMSFTGNDVWMCGGQYMNSSLSTLGGPFGIATSLGPDNTTTLPQGEFMVWDWNGLCLGTSGGSRSVFAGNASVGNSTSSP